MARFEFNESEIGTMGAAAQADILFELGMMYATGRDCDMEGKKVTVRALWSENSAHYVSRRYG